MNLKAPGMLCIAALVAALLMPPSTAAASEGEQPAVKISICHWTRSRVKPYTFIRVSEEAAEAHEFHGDLINAASPADCAAALATTGSQPKEKKDKPQDKATGEDQGKTGKGAGQPKPDKPQKPDKGKKPARP